jgi:NAD(P)H dehydrogenase (quinone)
MGENADVTVPAVNPSRPRVAIVGGGPGGYEAALVAAQLGADVTVVDADGLGGAAVLTDVVPSKTLIATADVMTLVRESEELGVRFPGGGSDARAAVAVDLGVVNRRVKSLALAQSADIRRRLEAEGVRVVEARGRLDGPHTVIAREETGREHRIEADTVLISVGAGPRERADPQLEAAVRPGRPARPTDRRRFRGDGRRVRQRLRRARRRRRPGVQS